MSSCEVQLFYIKPHEDAAPSRYQPDQKYILFMVAKVIEFLKRSCSKYSLAITCVIVFVFFSSGFCFYEGLLSSLIITSVMISCACWQNNGDQP